MCVLNKHSKFAVFRAWPFCVSFLERAFDILRWFKFHFLPPTSVKVRPIVKYVTWYIFQVSSSPMSTRKAIVSGQFKIAHFIIWFTNDINVLEIWDDYMMLRRRLIHFKSVPDIWCWPHPTRHNLNVRFCDDSNLSEAKFNVPIPTPVVDRYLTLKFKDLKLLCSNQIYHRKRPILA